MKYSIWVIVSLITLLAAIPTLAKESEHTLLLRMSLTLSGPKTKLTRIQSSHNEVVIYFYPEDTLYTWQEPGLTRNNLVHHFKGESIPIALDIITDHKGFLTLVFYWDNG